MEELLTGAFDDIVDVNPLDGVRLTFSDDSWVLVRPSGTEDYIRITLESRDAERAEEIKDMMRYDVDKLLRVISKNNSDITQITRNKYH